MLFIDLESLEIKLADTVVKSEDVTTVEITGRTNLNTPGLTNVASATREVGYRYVL